MLISGGTIVASVAIVVTVIIALLGVIAYFVKKIFDKTEKVTDQLRPITPAIVEIQGKFTEGGYTILFPLTVTPGSPLKLTEYGEKLMADSGFVALLNEHKAELVSAVRAKNPGTNYDIEKQSIEVLKELMNSTGYNVLAPLKAYAYGNGVSADILAHPGGVLLRNEVMKELKFDI